MTQAEEPQTTTLDNVLVLFLTCNDFQVIQIYQQLIMMIMP